MMFCKSHVRNCARPEGSMAEGSLAMESMWYAQNIMTTIDPGCPRPAWLGEVARDPSNMEEDRMTGAQGRRRLTPLEVEQVHTFMLSNHIATEEWRAYYDTQRPHGRHGVGYPSFHNYMKARLVEVEDLEANGQSVSHFPILTNDVQTLVAGPLLMVDSRTAMWSQG